ncbi:hypothetical protein Tco_0112056 [Tanacetum coccineum]
MDTAYRGFLGLGTTFDIFQNILILCIEYGVWISSGYSVLNFESLWFLMKYRNRYAVSSLMDMAYWMPEQGPKPKKKISRYYDLEWDWIDHYHILLGAANGDPPSHYKLTIKRVEKPTNEEIVKEFGLKSMGDIPLDEFGGADAKRFPNSYDGSLVNDDSLSDQVMQEADSDLESIPGDEIESLYGFEADESDNDDCQSMHKQELSKTDKAVADNILDEIAYMANSKNENVNASTDKDISSLTSRVAHLESSLAQQVADKIKDSVPRLVVDAFEERIPDLLSKMLKNTLPQIIKDSIKQAFPSLTNESRRLSMLKFLSC